MLEKIVDILKEYTDVPRRDIRPESYLVEDLGLNSVDCFAIIFDLEETFHIEIREEDVPTLRTVGDVSSCLGRMLA